MYLMNDWISVLCFWSSSKVSSGIQADAPISVAFGIVTGLLVAGTLSPVTSPIEIQCSVIVCILYLLWREVWLFLICPVLHRYVWPSAQVWRLHCGWFARMFPACYGLHSSPSWAAGWFLGCDWPYHQPSAHGDVCWPRKQVTCLLYCIQCLWGPSSFWSLYP